MQEIQGIVYLNGEFLPANEAKISVFDRGFIFGDGIYEVIPVINKKLVDRIEFWERFERSLKEIELTPPCDTKEDFEKILYEVIEKNNLIEGSLYIEITRGVAPRDFEFLKGLEQTIFVNANHKLVLQNPLSQTGIEIVSVEDLRWQRCDIKSVSLLAQCIAKTKAHRMGAFEGFMVRNGLVSEASSSSAFIIKNNTLIAPPLNNEILPGIRRIAVLKFAADLGLKIEYRKFSMEEVYESDECFISAATLLVIGVVKADGKIIADGKVGKFTQKFRQLYKQKMQKEAGLI